MDVRLAVASRREVRDYADRPIPEDEVQRILEAGRISGSSKNRQPWRFYVVEDPDVRDRVAGSVYAPDNVRGAPLAIAIAVSGKGPTSFDAGRAAQNIMLAAWNDGIGACPNGVADAEAMRTVLGLAEGESVVTVLSLGYPAHPREADRRSPEEWIARADRKPLEEIVEHR
ncbi:MAG TPA: nitroreductase family protein [Solirubrobacteraceae bacterium]|nr:nitroreductase family protein [Solirubrobacteraceae bacterium]